MEYRVFAKFNIVYGEGIRTPVGRLSFPYLTKMKDPPPPKDGQPQQGAPKYEVSLLLDKKDQSVKEFVKELEGYADEMLPLFNERAQNEIARVKRILRDGDLSDHEKYPNEKGMWILSARAKELPELYDSDLNPNSAEFFKGGMHVRLVVEPSLSSGGLGFGLKIVKFEKDDGTRFGGTPQDYKSLLADINSEESDDSEGDDTEDEATSEEDDSNGTVEAPPVQAAKVKTPKLSPAELAKAQAEANAKARKGGKGKQSAINLL